VGRCPAAVRRGVSDEQADGDSFRLPAQPSRDRGSKPLLLVELRQERAELDQLRLELDDEEGAGRRMPAQEVDGAALAVLRIGHLGAHSPVGQGSDPRRDVIGESGMAGVDDAIEVDRSRARQQLHPYIERWRQRRSMRASRMSRPKAMSSTAHRIGPGAYRLIAWAAPQHR
jgi:hypothetical protein